MNNLTTPGVIDFAGRIIESEISRM